MRICSGALAAAAALALGATGCRIDTHKNGDKGSDNVKIATPFGGMSVKTDEDVVQGGVGLSIYPGSTLIKKEKGKDSGAADVNMSFGGFHLGVKAMSYQTPDAPDKVLAFYRKDMAHYGSVIYCRDRKAIGMPARTNEGLTCDGDGGKNVHVSDHENDELKAGSKQHQHIVSVEPKDGGTKIGLVMLDLPVNIGGDDEDSKQ